MGNRKNRAKQDNHPTTPNQETRVVINLSGQVLNKMEEVLSLGLNYALTPREIPVDEALAGTEALAKHLGRATAVELKRITRQCLGEATTPEPNLTKEQSRDSGGRSVSRNRGLGQAPIDRATVVELKRIMRQCLGEATTPEPNLTKEQSRDSSGRSVSQNRGLGQAPRQSHSGGTEAHHEAMPG